MLFRSSLGTVPTGLPDGSAVAIALRPEAIRVDIPGNGGIPARVVSAHPLGRSTRLVLALDDGQRVRARIWGLHQPAPDTSVTIALDPAQAFVFPAE